MLLIQDLGLQGSHFVRRAGGGLSFPGSAWERTAREAPPRQPTNP
jgi:hypothetical protein